MTGLTVVAFESRRATEMAELIRHRGGEPVVAPSMREVPLEENAPALDALRELEAGRLDALVLLTGVGTRALLELWQTRVPRDRLIELLRSVLLVARGPKPVAALRQLGLTASVSAPEPNTWRELLAALDAQAPVSGRRIAVQEYGATNPELLAELTARGARVLRVPVYRWALPEDLAPLRNATRRWADGELDVALFTSATQADHLVRVAGDLGLLDALRNAARRMVIASIGPICSEELRRHQLNVDLEPEHPKMGHLVASASARATELLSAKRAQR